MKCPRCTMQFQIPNLDQSPAAPTVVRARRVTDPVPGKTEQAFAKESPAPESSPRRARRVESTQSSPEVPSRPARRKRPVEEPDEFTFFDDGYSDYPEQDLALPPRSRAKSRDSKSISAESKSDGRSPERKSGRKSLRNMTADELSADIRRGGRFIRYSYAVSLVVISMKYYSKPQYIPAGSSAFWGGVPYTLMTLGTGWWGFPWGPIFTITAIVQNLSGGMDVTHEVMG